jgi:glycosyltransferase involved in cell wall biosynthesis
VSREISINVLFLIYDLERGGPEMRLLDLQKNSPAYVKMYFCVTSRNLALLTEFLEADARVFVEPVGKGYLELNKIWNIYKYVMMNHISILNSFGLKELFLSIAIKVMTFWKIKTVHHSVNLLHNYGTFHKIFLLILLKLTDKVLCNSEKSHTLMRTFFVPERKLSIIRNGIDIDFFKKSISHAKSFREINGITKDNFVLGTVANFRKVKNYPFLMKAFRILFRRNKDLKLICVGDGYYLSDIKRMALEYDLERAVIFTGRSRHVAEYLSTMDVFVLCSSKEGFPNVLLQAMSVGLPVVSADVGGCGEIITHMKNGILYPSNDLGKFIEAVERLKTEPDFANRLGSNAKRSIKENLSLDRMIKEYTIFYYDLSGFRNDLPS